MIPYFIVNKVSDGYEIKYYKSEARKEVSLKDLPAEIAALCENVEALLDAETLPEEKIAIVEREIEEVRKAKEVVEQEKTAIIEQRTVLEETATKYRSVLLSTDLSEDQMLLLVNIFPEWEEETVYEIDEKIRYEERLYRVIQPHTSQEDWTPEISRALFTEIAPPGVVREWIQPLGAHDVYNTGDMIVFEDVVYTCLSDANVWSPADYAQGWLAEVSDTPVIPDESEMIFEWVQPTGAHDAYDTGDQMIFENEVYESLVDANVHSPIEAPNNWALMEEPVVEEPVEEPVVEEPVEEPIVEEPIVEPDPVEPEPEPEPESEVIIPQWVQPTGAHDAYDVGFQVTFNGEVYESLIPANTYSPTAYPAGWKKIV